MYLQREGLSHANQFVYIIISNHLCEICTISKTIEFKNIQYNYFAGNKYVSVLSYTKKQKTGSDNMYRVDFIIIITKSFGDIGRMDAKRYLDN